MKTLLFRKRKKSFEFSKLLVPTKKPKKKFNTEISIFVDEEEEYPKNDIDD